MDASEAADAVVRLRAGPAVPMHNGDRRQADEFAARVERRHGRCLVPGIGEAVTI